jgi:pimeloyl-ACP methyl ester carboxylesterase
MRKLLSLLLTLLSVSAVYAQTEPANYAAAISKFKTFYNNNKPDSIYNMFGTEMRAAVSKEQIGQLKNQLGTLNQITFTAFTAPTATYNAAFQNGPLVVSLSLNKENQIIGLGFRPAEHVATPTVSNDDPALTETPISLKVFTGNISGTLTMPKNASGKIPVVLIIAGSGPTDRDGNSVLGVSGYTYKLMANALGKNGIASLRYDKRGVGKSITSTKEKDMRFEDYADDAIALVGMLHNDERFSKVIVMGHSEGSLVGMLASDDQPVNGYISLAGAGDRIDKIMIEQMKSKPDFLQDAFKIIVDSLRKGKFTDRVDPSLYSLIRPSAQPYILSWMMHDPIREIKKLKIPILIVQGTTDIQVSVSDAEKLKKAKSDATLLIIPGMNHVLKEAPADREKNAETYKDPNLPLKPELVTGVVGFINKLK